MRKRWIGVILVAVVIATVLGLWLPFRISVSGDNGFISINMGSSASASTYLPPLDYSRSYDVGEAALGLDNKYYILSPTGDYTVIGDAESATFKPTIELNRWGQECQIKLGLPLTGGTVNISSKAVTGGAITDKVVWESDIKDNTRIEAFYESAKGSFEFDIILKQKPLSNVQTLTFNSNNLVFYYQPPLTEEFKDGYSEEFQTDIFVTETDVKDKDGNILVHRPENVVGSYAVYYPPQEKGMKTVAEGEKYKTGKAFHWYRPLIYDNAGHTCWGVLNVGQGQRTVTIPQSFLIQLFIQ